MLTTVYIISLSDLGLVLIASWIDDNILVGSQKVTKKQERFNEIF